MGGSSKSTTSKMVNYTTNTTTKTSMGDVGLTGAQSVDMAAVLHSGAIARDEIQADVMNNLVMATGNAWNQLIGGAGHLVETSRAVAENTVSVLPVMTEAAKSGYTEGAKAGAKAAEGVGRTLPLLAVGMAGVVLLFVVLPRRKG